MVIKHSYLILKHNKLRTLLFVLLYGFCMFSICFIPTIFDAQYITEMNKNLQEYGRMNAVICDLDEAQFEEMDNDFSILSYQKGYTEKYGEILLENPETKESVSALIGHVDSTSRDFGNIDVKEGRYPSSASEIAIEEKTVKASGNTIKTGDTLELMVGSKTYSFKVTGILKDYTKNLMYSLPNIVVGDKLDEKVSTRDLMLFFRWALSYREPGCLRFPEKVITASSLPHSKAQYNYYVYSVKRPYSYDANQTFLMVGIFATIVFVVFIIFSNFLNNLERVIYDLRLFGATNRYIAMLKIVVSFMTLLLSVAVYFVIYYIIISITENVLGVRIYLLNSITSQVLFGSMVIFPMFLLIYSVVDSIRKGIKPVSFSTVREQRIYGRTIQSTKLLDFNFAFARMKYKRFKLLSFGIVVAIFVSVILVMTEDVDTKILRNLIGHDHKIAFERIEPEEGEYIKKDGIIFTRNPGGTDYEETESYKDMELASVEYEFMARYPSLIVKGSKDNEYARRMFERTDGSEAEKFNSGSSWATPYTEGNFVILEITEENYTDLDRLYRNGETQEAIDAGKALVIFNGFEIGEDEKGDMQYLPNDLYEDGDLITFGWYESEASVKDAEKDPSLLKYKEESFEIYSVYYGSVFTRQLFKQYNGYTALVFLPEDVVKSSELTAQVSRTTLIFNSFMRLRDYRVYEKELFNPYLEKNGFIHANYMDQEQLRDTTLEIETLTHVKDLLIGCEIILVLFAIVNIVFEKFKEFERTFMTLRSIGYRTWHIILTIFVEYFCYYLIELLVILVFDIILCFIYIPNIYSFPVRTMGITKFIFYFRFAIANTGTYAMILSGVVLVVTVIITLVTVYKKLVNYIRIKE